MDKYFLHINEPCSQDWESMTTDDKGKFCSSCNKTVFDFTTATDNEIVKHIEAMKGEIFCGQFKENQLDRWIEKSNIKTINPRLYKFFLSFMLLGAAQNTQAQTISPQEKVDARRKVDSLLNLQSINSEIGTNKCDTINKGVFSDTRIRLGGVRTLSGTREPLMIVDGSPIKLSLLNKLNPNKVIKVTVLKSAESTSIYGPDGVNGALIITTKYSKKELKEVLQ